MSTRLFQGIIHQMKDAIDRTVGIVDDNGVIIACSDLSKIGNTCQGIRNELTYTTDAIISDGFTYKAISSVSKIEYIIFIEGEDKMAEVLAAALSVSLNSAKDLYDEKYDKGSFIKNVILDNILPSDIYVKARELHFSNDTVRIVMLMKFSGKNEITPYQIVQNMFPDKNKDYVISVGERDIVLVKELKTNFDIKGVEKMAESIADTVNTEFFTTVSIGIGTPVDTIKDLARSYKEAQIALEVGKIFDNENDIVFYDNLGIGRLIYQLPTTLCEMFLKEVFRHGSLESLDRETLATIQCFFENNLNVSETSRKLFIHRNTLVYRLEKIRKLTGLDLREFDHATTFKVAMMVKKYMATKPVKY